MCLAALGTPCAWLGTLGSDSSAEFICRSLADSGVDVRLARRHANHDTPTSYVTVNSQTGSRTIVHHASLPELSLLDFSSSAEVDLASYAWVHFEGSRLFALNSLCLP